MKKQTLSFCATATVTEDVDVEVDISVTAIDCDCGESLDFCAVNETGRAFGMLVKRHICLPAVDPNQQLLWADQPVV